MSKNRPNEGAAGDQDFGSVLLDTLSGYFNRLFIDPILRGLIRIEVIGIDPDRTMGSPFACQAVLLEYHFLDFRILVIHAEEGKLRPHRIGYQGS